MIETAFAFILGILLTWPALVALVIIALGFEHNRRHGWTVIALAGIVTIATILLSLTWVHLLIGAGAWIPIGLAWSRFRWTRYTRTIIDQAASGALAKSTARERVIATNNLDTITFWILAWPFSVLESILGDVITGIQRLVKTTFRGMYAKISADALAEIDGLGK